MADIDHIWGQDISYALSGDLATVEGVTQVEQRLLRRFMTNLGGNVWAANYGAGLPTFVMTPIHEASIRAIVVQQCALEADVGQDPPPVITITSDGVSALYLRVQFTYAPTGVSGLVAFGLGG
jgi:hypothetical protein